MANVKKWKCQRITQSSIVLDFLGEKRGIRNILLDFFRLPWEYIMANQNKRYFPSTRRILDFFGGPGNKLKRINCCAL
jgi:hypothetical protein